MFTKYLGIKHNYKDMNCLLFIEKIYIDMFNIYFPRDRWKLEGTDGLRSLLLVKVEDLFIIEGWQKINLTNINSYDILIFKDSKDRIKHFGMYICNNKFIHLPERSSSMISDFNENYRSIFAGAVRCKKLDSSIYRDSLQT